MDFLTELAEVAEGENLLAAVANEVVQVEVAVAQTMTGVIRVLKDNLINGGGGGGGNGSYPNSSGGGGGGSASAGSNGIQETFGDGGDRFVVVPDRFTALF